MSNPDAGPYLLTSVLCKEVLTDHMGNPTGVAGMTANAGVDAPDQKQNAAVRLEVKVLVVLVAGQGRGKSFYVELHPETPSGTGLGHGRMPIRFADDEHAIATIAVDYAMDLGEAGVYWIDVSLTPSNGGPKRLLTRMPLEFVHKRSP